MIDLDAIRARLAAITPGPRRVRIEEWEAQAYVDLPNGDVITFDTDCAPDDAEFDAAAPADVAALLAEVERIAALERALEHATLVIENYEMDIRNSDWTGVNLAAVGFCQGVIYRRALRTVQSLAQPKGGDNHARS